MPYSLIFAIVDTVSILFLGDVMQHKEQLHNALLPDSDSTVYTSYDYSSYFEHIDCFIEDADFAVANMEFCLGGAPYSGYPAFSAPESLPIECRNAGIDLFLCANNHILDRGRKGIKNTLDTYDDIGVPYTGIYRDREDEIRDNPFIADIGGVQVAFIHFTYGTNGIQTPAPYIVSRMEQNSVSKVIKRAKERNADIIIALPHWGVEYELNPSEEQLEWQHFLYSQGVDAIIGTHPHVIQPLDITPNMDNSLRFTAFSLGNLISNMSRHDTELGLALRLDIGITELGYASIIGYEAIPLWSARPGKFEDSFTIIPIKDFYNHPELFRNKWSHHKMVETYNRLKHLFKSPF